MHNHLISFAQYEKATDTLSVFIKALGLAAQAVKESPLVKAIQLFAEYLEVNADAEQGNLSVDPNPEEEHNEKLDDQ